MGFDELSNRLRASPASRVGRGASQDAVDQAELALGVVFPSQLREYLTRFGWLEVEDREFLGLGDGVPSFLDLVRTTLSERHEAGAPLPTALIPLLNDGGGNLYCIVAKPNAVEHGTIVFWDHERGVNQVPEYCFPDLYSWISSILDEASET